MIPFAANALQCIVNGQENPPKMPLPLGCCHPARGGPSHGHRQHPQKNLWRSCVWFQKYARGQTDRQTDGHAHTHRCAH